MLISLGKRHGIKAVHSDRVSLHDIYVKTLRGRNGAEETPS